METAAEPTRQHSIKCPKIYGEQCKCDGYHTFDELYDHRITLYIALTKRLLNSEPSYSNGSIWRSKLHHDGTSFDGWFILGIRTDPSHQITYHLPLSRWDETDFAWTRERAPEWDSHTSDDVIERLKHL